MKTQFPEQQPQSYPMQRLGRPGHLLPPQPQLIGDATVAGPGTTFGGSLLYVSMNLEVRKRRSGGWWQGVANNYPKTI